MSRGVEDEAQGYRFQILVCHHRSMHYLAYVRLQNLWVRLYDTAATILGSLVHVLDERCANQMQPEIATLRPCRLVS